jgi:hypothetical protein
MPGGWHPHGDTNLQFRELWLFAAPVVVDAGKENGLPELAFT